MDKKILIILSSIMLTAMLFVGCNSSSNQVDASNNRFIISDQYISVSTFSDSKTGVEYAIIQECGHGYIEVVVLQNADGTPKVR